MSQYIFGPVPSRRLGRSLGIDLVPFKTCTYDCIYCQLGRTTHKTLTRRAWAPCDAVWRELAPALAARPDYITLSGSGEPTLFSPLHKLIEGIRTLTAIPVAVLTNGSLLYREDVQDELLGADLVIPSLDAGDSVTFEQVNRPHRDLVFERVLEGLVGFQRRFRGRFWLEVFLVNDLTTSAAQLAAIRHCVARIRPDRVQLNTVTRPPAESFASPVPHSRLQDIAATFAQPAEVIADFQGAAAADPAPGDRHEILQLLRRRPCSIDDIASGLRLHRLGVLKILEQLHREHRVELRTVAGTSYYRITTGSMPDDLPR